MGNVYKSAVVAAVAVGAKQTAVCVKTCASVLFTTSWTSPRPEQVLHLSGKHAPHHQQLLKRRAVVRVEVRLSESGDFSLLSRHSQEERQAAIDLCAVHSFPGEEGATQSLSFSRQGGCTQTSARAYSIPAPPRCSPQ